MPSHIIYSAIDEQNSAINSQKVLDFIRENVNKDINLLIVSHKPLDVIKKIGKKNRIGNKDVRNIV